MHDGLLTEVQLRELIEKRKAPGTSLCLTGRDFPKSLEEKADIDHRYDQD